MDYRPVLQLIELLRRLSDAGLVVQRDTGGGAILEALPGQRLTKSLLDRLPVGVQPIEQALVEILVGGS